MCDGLIVERYFMTEKIMEPTKKPKSRLKKIVLISVLCFLFCILLIVGKVSYVLLFDNVVIVGDSTTLLKGGVD